MTSLLLGLRVKPKDAPLLLIEATSAATVEMGPPIVKSSKKPNVSSLARERRRGGQPSKRGGGQLGRLVERLLENRLFVDHIEG